MTSFESEIITLEKRMWEATGWQLVFNQDVRPVSDGKANGAV